MAGYACTFKQCSNPYRCFMRHIYFGLLLMAASSCTVYQPLLATLPAVRKPGDVAVVGSWQFPYGAQI